MSHLLGRTSRVEADLMDQLFTASEKRLARLLAPLAHYGGENQQMIPADISQEMLAEMIGTPGRASILHAEFRKLGFITYNGGIKSTHRCFLRWSNKNGKMILIRTLPARDQLGEVIKSILAGEKPHVQGAVLPTWCAIFIAAPSDNQGEQLNLFLKAVDDLVEM